MQMNVYTVCVCIHIKCLSVDRELIVSVVIIHISENLCKLKAVALCYSTVTYRHSNAKNALISVYLVFTYSSTQSEMKLFM